MGTELFAACLNGEDIDFPAVPPGFESFSSAKLKKLGNVDSEPCCSVSSNLSQQESVNLKNQPGDGAVGKISRCLRRKPSINYSRYNECSDEESDSEQLDQTFPIKPGLPKGVIRGCADCQNCQKVIARWHPEAACWPDLEEVPVFYPTQEEFKDTIRYIEKIRLQAESYGICRIVPPPLWKPPCRLKEHKIWERSKFATRVQKVDKLQNRDASRKTSRGNNHTRKKKRRCSRMGMVSGAGIGNNLEIGEADFGFEPGPEFTLHEFQRYADDFKAQYFRNGNHTDLGGESIKSVWEPTIEAIEGEYWRVVEKPSEEIEVLYGADLETGVFGSGFPKVSDQNGSSFDEEYVRSGWNLNNLPRLSGSVLSYENGDISGVQVPWLYVGMCFSSFCWHVEDHHLYSLNYLHFGAPKVWYGVPGSDAVKMEDAMKKHLPDLFDEQPDLLHKLVTQLSPSILKLTGVPVYRCVQKEGEFVMTFPRAYHAGFNCGFNCAEAVNVAPIDWFPHGQKAIELYREQRRKTTVSHDKLLLGAAREAVKANWELNLLRKNTTDNLRWRDVCGKDGILAKSLRARVESEKVRRDFLCKFSKVLKMENSFDSTTERECCICSFDLHLSAAGCHCSPDRFACLNHAKQFCSCGWDSKFFLFRYDIAELNLLVDALEGKLSAIYRWARHDLGLALSSCISKNNSEASGLIGAFSEHPGGNITCKTSSQPIVTSKIKDNNGKISISLAPSVGKISTAHKGSFPETVLALESTKVPPIKLTRPGKRKSDMLVATKAPCGDDGIDPADKLAKKSMSFCQGSAVLKQSTKSLHGQVDVICLSDDEDDQSNKLLCNTSIGALSQGTPDVPERRNSDHKLNLSDLANAALAAEGNLNLISDGQKHDFFSRSISPKDETHMKCEAAALSDEPNISCLQGSIDSISDKREPDASTPDSVIQNTDRLLSLGHRIKDRDESFVPRSKLKVLDDARTLPEIPSCSKSSFEKHHRQKGPRIAKFVRRINCNVELLEPGVVISGKLWSTSRAIFPKGYKSRVRYINIYDPTNMCNYISEILDGGSKGPLFMLSLEDGPGEVFVDVSPMRCWEMIRERVNQEISKQHKLGKMKLPPLQPPGSLDGVEMFGFTSPAIIQVIEALDKSRACSEYWNSRPLAQISRCFQSRVNNQSRHRPEDANVQKENKLLMVLFKKATVEELSSLLDCLAKNQSLVTRLLNEELQNRSL